MFEEKIKKSKEMIESLLSKTWEVEKPFLDKNGKILIPQPDKLSECLIEIEKLFLAVFDIYNQKDKDPIKDQLRGVKIHIEWVTEAIESAYLMPSREFLIERLNDSLGIIEEQEKEMDNDEKHYGEIWGRINDRFGEDVADSIYWNEDENK